MFDDCSFEKEIWVYFFGDRPNIFGNNRKRISKFGRNVRKGRLGRTLSQWVLILF